MINDLVNKDGNLYSLQEFDKIYNTKNIFLSYHSIITAINKYKNKQTNDCRRKHTILPGIPYNGGPRDAGDPESIATLMTQAKDTWGQIDFIVHAIGFSDKSELRGQYINTSRGNFLMTIEWKEKL